MMLWLRRLHAWLGLGLCLVLALIALTGSLLVYRPQVRDLGRAPAGTPAAEAQAAIVQAIQARFGSDAFTSIVFASPDAAWSEARLRGGGHAWVDGAGMVQPFTALDAGYETLFDLHHQLLSGEAGERLVGIIGVAALAMALSGLVLWWPARRSFRGRMWPDRPSRAGWLAAHRDLALMAAPVILISLATGAALALPDVARPLMAAPAPQPPKGKVGSGPANWPAALAAARARFPAATVRMAIAPGGPGRPASIRLRQPGEWHANVRTVVYLDPASGAVLGAYDAMAQNRGARAYNAAWPVHAAKSGGPLWKLVTFLGGLGLAALSLFGGEAYRRRLMGLRRPRAA